MGTFRPLDRSRNTMDGYRQIKTTPNELPSIDVFAKFHVINSSKEVQMEITKSSKLPGFIQIDINGIHFHAGQREAGDAYILSYWDTLTKEIQMQSLGLKLPSKQQALSLIQSGALNSYEFVPLIVGPEWLLCWLSDHSAIATNPDTHEYWVYENASGLGQAAPVWFVEQ